MERKKLVSEVAKLFRGVPVDEIDAFVAEAKKELGLLGAEDVVPADQAAIPAPAPDSSLFQLVGTIAVPAMTKAGKVSDLFVVNTTDSARVKISYVGDNFKSWFGEMIVGSQSGSTLSYHTLRRNAYDREIHDALGGKDKCVTNLAEIWWLMEQQKNGESGILLTNGYANIFYIYDGASALRAVFVDWDDDGWGVGAFELDYGYWSEPGRVFVPASSVGSSC